MNKELGGVLMAFAGVVVLVGAVRGTWRDVWSALWGKPSRGSDPTNGGRNYPGGAGAPAGADGAPAFPAPGQRVDPPSWGTTPPAPGAGVYGGPGDVIGDGIPDGYRAAGWPGSLQTTE